MADRDESSLPKEKLLRKRLGGKKCAAYGCDHRSGEYCKKNGITFHAFPWSKPEVAKEWEHAMHRKGFTATINSRVCSSHFTPDCFDRSGLRVQLKAGSMPTLVELPGHPKKRVQHRNAPTKRNGPELTEESKPVEHPCEPAVEASCKRLRVVSVEHPCEPVEHPCEPALEASCKRRKVVSLAPPCEPALEASCKHLRVVSLAPPCEPALEASCKRLRIVSVASHQISNIRVPPSKLRLCDGHNYSLPSPKVLKNKLSKMESALVQYKHQVKMLKQKNRRLQSKVESLQQLVYDLQQKNLISQQVADNLQSSFSPTTLQLISRMLKGKARQGTGFPDELKTFALTLQLYSSRAYDYVRQKFNYCLPHPRTLSSWYSGVDCNPGLNDEIVSDISEHVQGNAKPNSQLQSRNSLTLTGQQANWLVMLGTSKPTATAKKK